MLRFVGAGGERPRRSLPEKFYRVDRENAFTEYIPAVPGEKLDFAFRARGSFDLVEELTKDRVERHLNWYDTAAPPSSFISVFDSYGQWSPEWSPYVNLIETEEAEERARFHYHVAPPSRRARRIPIAEISTAGLVEAVLLPSVSSPAIPIWVDRTTSTERWPQCKGQFPAVLRLSYGYP